MVAALAWAVGRFANHMNSEISLLPDPQPRSLLLDTSALGNQRSIMRVIGSFPVRS